MKKIKMDYDEYVAMVDLVNKQQEQLEVLKKASNVVIIDTRINDAPSLDWFSGRVPKIIGSKEDAKELLQDEFDALYKNLVFAQRDIRNLRSKKKSFWQRVFG